MNAYYYLRIMIRLLVIYTLFLINSNNAFSINDSIQIDHLKYICKTWGVLKYHTNVSDKAANWDLHLINELKKYKKKHSTYEEVLFSLVKNANIESTKTKDSVKQNGIIELVDLDWFNDSLIPAEISFFLDSSRRNYEHKKNEYIHLSKNYILEFVDKREVDLSKVMRFEEKMWLLFTLWNRIEYYFPYKHQLLYDWDLILSYSIEEMIEADSKSELIICLFKIVNALNDSHTLILRNQYLDKEVFGIYYSGFNCIIQNKKVFISRIKANIAKGKGNLRVGDEIIATSKGKLKDIYDKVQSYAPYSSKIYQDKLIQIEIERSITATKEYVIKRDGNEYIIKIQSLSYLEKEMSPYPISSGVLYFKATDFPKFSILGKRKKLIKKLLISDTLILDLRDYINHSFTYLFAKKILSEKVYFDEYIPSKGDTKPGQFILRKSRSYGGIKKKYNGLLILLVDSYTSSIGEHTAMILQQYDNCVTVGTKTWGVAGYITNLNVAGPTYTSQLTISLKCRINKTFYDENGLYIDHLIDYKNHKSMDIDKKDFLLFNALDVVRSQ